MFGLHPWTKSSFEAEDYWNYMFQDSANETPLHVAARGGWLEVCCCLAHHVPKAAFGGVVYPCVATTWVNV